MKDRLCVMILGTLLGCSTLVSAYPVGPAMSLADLIAEADFIFKGTVVGGKSVKDEWFKPHQGFHAHETRFTVVSVIKGQFAGHAMAFRHYDRTPKSHFFRYKPQYYHFNTGRTYIVFAKSTGAPGVVRQLWKNHKSREDQGVFLCSNGKRVMSKTVKDAVWAELTASLASASTTDVIYAIRQLDQASGEWNSFDDTEDFKRKDVLEMTRGLMSSRTPEVAQAAISLVGSRNPYMSDGQAIMWLAAVGSAEFPGNPKMDPNLKNTGGELYWRDLVVLADSKRGSETRAMAIRALGLVRKPALMAPIKRWLADPAPQVRASASLLLADFGDPDSSKHLRALARDPSPMVRACVSRAIGFKQADSLDVLANLLRDKEKGVRKASAMSLLAFSPKNEAVEEIFMANIDNREFHPLFLNALARENPAAHLDALAKVVEEKAEPQTWWGGKIPAFVAWEILFKHLWGLPHYKARSGNLDRYLDAMEKVGNYSSSQPCHIYAFYLQRGMDDRAIKYRHKATKASSYNLDYYFDRVDKFPRHYKPQ